MWLVWFVIAPHAMSLSQIAQSEPNSNRQGPVRPAAVVLAGIAPALEAQWPVRLGKRLPLTPDDKVDMHAKPLQTAD